MNIAVTACGVLRHDGLEMPDRRPVAGDDELALRGGFGVAPDGGLPVDGERSFHDIHSYKSFAVLPDRRH